MHIPQALSLDQNNVKLLLNKKKKKGKKGKEKRRNTKEGIKREQGKQYKKKKKKGKQNRKKRNCKPEFEPYFARTPKFESDLVRKPNRVFTFYKV